MAGGCSLALVPRNDTTGSTPLAQSSSKARSGFVAAVGLSGSPMPPGVPSPYSVPAAFTALYSAGSTRPFVLKLANQEPV